MKICIPWTQMGTKEIRLEMQDFVFSNIDIQDHFFQFETLMVVFVKTLVCVISLLLERHRSTYVLIDFIR